MFFSYVHLKGVELATFNGYNPSYNKNRRCMDSDVVNVSEDLSEILVLYCGRMIIYKLYIGCNGILQNVST